MTDHFLDCRFRCQVVTPISVEDSPLRGYFALTGRQLRFHVLGRFRETPIDVKNGTTRSDIVAMLDTYKLLGCLTKETGSPQALPGRCKLYEARTGLIAEFQAFVVQNFPIA